jgi:tetratricopeptide (TPR) repeat protein
MATSYDNIGSLYFSQGDFERAFEWQKKALDISVELGASGDLIYRHFNVGTDLLKLGRRVEATEYIRRAFELCDQLDLPHLAGQLMGDLRSMDADIAEVQGWMGDTTAD